MAAKIAASAKKMPGHFLKAGWLGEGVMGHVEGSIKPPAEAKSKVAWIPLRLPVGSTEESVRIECHGIGIERGIVKNFPATTVVSPYTPTKGTVP